MVQTPVARGRGCGALLAAVLLAPAVAAQQGFRPARGDSLYSLPRSQEEMHLLDKSRDELAAGKHREAVERLLQLWRDNRGGVVPNGLDRHLGVRLAVLRTLAGMPPAARAAYDRLVEREGGERLQAPLSAQQPAALEALARDFPASSKGLAARSRLGHLAMEAGDGLSAAEHFRAALDGCPPHSTRARQLDRALQQARALLRPRVHRNHNLPGFDTEALEPILDALPTGLDPSGWSSFGGGHGGITPMERPAGRPVDRGRITRIRPPQFERNTLAMHAVGGLDGVFLCDGQSVWAIDPLRSEVSWIGEGPMARERYMDAAVNENMGLCAAVGRDVVIAALEVPVEEAGMVFSPGITILTPIPERRLHAFDRATGKELWAHWDRFRGPVTHRFRRHVASSPPLVHGETVYCATHDRSGTIAFYVAAYHLDSGEPKWRRLVCSSQEEVNMFGNARKEFASSPLTLVGGVLYGSTNLGINFAVDARTGDMRWVSGYEVLSMPRTRLRRQNSRPVYFANNPPVVVDGVVVSTPLDSRNVVAMDAHDGRILWELDWLAQAGGNISIHWLLGAIGDEVVLSGRGVVAVKARSEGNRPRVRLIKSAESLGLDRTVHSPNLGRGAVTDEHIYFCTPTHVSVFDIRGNLDHRSTDLRLGRPGNLFLVDGIAMSVARGNVAIAYDRQSLIERAEALVRRNPNDVASLFRLAGLLRRDGGAGKEALGRAGELFEEALVRAEIGGMGPGVPLFDAIALELFRLAFGQAQKVTGEEALELFRLARDRAPDPDSWLRAHVKVLARTSDSEAFRAELEVMARSHGPRMHTFGEDGRLPVSAWAAWQQARSLTDDDPAAAVIAWQDLMERHPSRVYTGRTGRALALEVIAALIAAHGNGIYAPVERRARAALQMAREGRQFQAILDLFPHSEAAGQARMKTLDLAVASGDLASACDVVAQLANTGTVGAGALRRLQLVAARSGNYALAAAIGDTLVTSHGSATSDVPADGGRTYAAVAALPAPIPWVPPALDMPLHLLADLDTRNKMTTIGLFDLHIVAGFEVPGDVPLYVNAAGDTLRAYDIPRRERFDAPLFETGIDFVPTLILTGDVVLVPGFSAIRALHYRTGQVLWELPGRSDQMFEEHGLLGGVLLVVVQQRTGRGDRELLAVEPLTGAILASRRLVAGVHSVPRHSGGRLLIIEATEDGAAIVDLDPVTCLERQRVPLTDELLEALGLGRERLLQESTIQRLVADRDTLWLAVDHLGEDQPPRVAALAPDGSRRWLWEGFRGRNLHLRGARAGRYVVVEDGAQSGGRVLVFDGTTGQIELERPLGHAIHAVNAGDDRRGEPLPEALMLSDRPRSGPLRLTCVALTGTLPSFRLDMHPGDMEIARSPWIGDGFLAFGTRRHSPDDRFLLHVLDLTTRKGLFPGEKPHTTLPITPFCEVHRVGRYTVVSSKQRLIVLGHRERNR